MRILFDYQAFALQTYGGISRCFFELYKRLIIGNDVCISVRESENEYLRQFGYGQSIGYYFNHFISQKSFCGKTRLFNLYNSFRYGKEYKNKSISYTNFVEYDKLESIRALKKGNFDVFHPTYYDDYFLPYLKGKPFVLTIHDMIPELFPQYHNEEYNRQIAGKQKLSQLASAIITVSNNTKADVVRILGVSEDKVHVVYHGSEHIKQNTRKSFHSFCDTQYILYVGERSRYKNFFLFAESIAPLLKTQSGLRVICTGHPFVDEERNYLTALGIFNYFEHQWITDNNEMYSLYNNAVCFVFPSEYEGFGIPILEAYSADCPVLLNNTSCFSEIAGDAAMYFTFDILSQQVEKVLHFTDEERHSLLIRQRSRLQQYTWEKSAKKLESIYKSIK